MRKGLVDSMVLMDYDNKHDEAIYWWETQIEDGWEIYVSKVSVMESLKGVARQPGDRRMNLESFRDRIQQMLREKKIRRILPITQNVFEQAHLLLEKYCHNFTPPQSRERMEALICDMLIAATALKHGLVLFTHNIKDFEWIGNLTIERPDY